MKLSRSSEDYLEIMLVLKEEKRHIKVKDIASRLDVKLPSVSEMIKKLAAKGLVRYERYGLIELTPKGKKIAKEVYSRHKLLTDFFLILGVEKKIALRDACLAEHILHRKTMQKIKSFVKKRV